MRLSPGIQALIVFRDWEFEHAELHTSISVLCPYATNTKILDSERNPPSQLSEKSHLPNSEKYLANLGKMVKSITKGDNARSIAEITLSAIIENRFYVLPTNDLNESIVERANSIVNGHSPVR